MRYQSKKIVIMRNFEQKPAAFIGKLFNIVREHAKVIAWDVQHKGVVILSQKGMEEKVLPRFFRHNKFSSFVRQLNMYGFHKAYLPNHRPIFLHPHFTPKDKENLHFIRRKTKEEQKQQPQSGGDSKRQIQVEQIEPQRNGIINNAFEQWSKSSKKVLCVPSIRNAPSVRQLEPHILEEIKSLFNNQKQITKKDLSKKIAVLKRQRGYRELLLHPSLLKQIYAAFGFEACEEDDVSELSIEDAIWSQTMKTIKFTSLKLVDTEHVSFRRDDLSNFL